MFSIVKCLLTESYVWKILITCYTSCSVVFGVSFNGKNINVNTISYEKMRGRDDWSHLSSDNSEVIHVTKVPKDKAFLQLIRNLSLKTCALGFLHQISRVPVHPSLFLLATPRHN